jgi:hypothetical protein
MVVNACPAAVTSAPPELVWRVLTTPERFGEWLDASFVSASPPGLGGLKESTQHLIEAGKVCLDEGGVVETKVSTQTEAIDRGRDSGAVEATSSW